VYGYTVLWFRKLNSLCLLTRHAADMKRSVHFITHCRQYRWAGIPVRASHGWVAAWAHCRSHMQPARCSSNWRWFTAVAMSA